MTTKLATSGKKRKLVNIHLLDGSEFAVHVDVKSKFQEVFNQITGYLSLRETEYFGLAFKKDNEYQFVVLDEKIHKHAPKHWKSGPGEGVDSQGRAIINVWFCVQFYVDQVILLREKITRHQYYLQLKENVLHYNHVYSEEKCFQQAAYALQADFGSYVREKHSSGYFNPALYFPPWIVERHGTDYLAKNVPTLHRDLHNMTRNDAELRYIRNASIPPGALNLHFYMVRKHKADKHCNAWLAICARGVEVYEDDAGYKNHVSTFMWKDIGKLYFDKKKFEIRCVQSAGGRRFDYYTDCDTKSKYLLSICRSTHMFQMSTQPKLMEIQHLDNEDQKRYRESYMSTESRDRKHFHHSPSTSTNASVSSNNQRLSVVSDASSNTTSGIVSDRNAVSFDDDDDHSREVMIDCSALLPRQMKSKLQIVSGFSHGQHYSDTVSPNLSLEGRTLEDRNGSAHELTVIGSCGSWRTRHSHTSGCLLGTAGLTQPSSMTPIQDSKSCLHVGRCVGYKDIFGRHGPLLQTMDRNTSGDSAVSVSGGIFTGSDKVSPMSFLAPLEQQKWCVTPGDGLVATAKAPSCLPHTSPVNEHTKSTNGSTSPLVLNFISSSKVSTPPRVLTPHISPLDVTTKLSLAEADTQHEYWSSPATPRTDNDHYKPSDSPQDVSRISQPVRSYQDNSSEEAKLMVPAQGDIIVQPTRGNLSATATFSPLVNDNLLKGKLGDITPTNGPNMKQKSLLSGPFNTENQHIVKVQVHQSACKLKQVPHTTTEHYRMALQQGSGSKQDKKISSQKELTERLLNAVTPAPEKCHQSQYLELQHPTDIQQLQHHQQNENQKLKYQQLESDMQHQQEKPENHLLQQLLHEPENQVLPQQQQQADNQWLQHQPPREQQMQTEQKSHKSQPQVQMGDSPQEMEDRKDVCQDENIDNRIVHLHNKASLHPELKHILGQSHAFSLPLMTALCNDSTLMQTSRSQSGSRSSYETSTMRSTDSRLTRLSHDTDSRRWSSCCQAANVPDMMLVQSCRPYSWHSEHLELDTQLPLPAAMHLAPSSPPNARNINNKHLLNCHQNLLPQKMIVSDPGPSSPRLLTMGGGTSWWESPPSATELDGILSSWTGIIPYHLSAHGSQQLNTNHPHQQMVPHKLSSGGHRDSETSITHKQLMKENIAIA